MMKSNKSFHRKIISLFALFVFCASAFAQNSASIKLEVDASEAARNILHVRETMTVKPGELTLFYPKWIPGEHAPTGTLNNMVNLFVTANGKPIAWRRDDLELFAFHITVPEGADKIEIAFDDVSEPATTMSAQLARVKWNRLVLYPRGASSDDVQVTASMRMPAGWQYATALPVGKESKTAVDFKTVSLETFVDSPAIIGKNFKRVTLSNDGGVLHEMDIAADTSDALEYKPETLAGWKNLIKEGQLLFGAKHYNSYRFLVTLSDVGGGEGLEHHESSEDGVGEKALSDPLELIDFGELLGHEYAHSWNGKYRRPAGLNTSDFEQPMRGDLLWIYEGLTNYLGTVLPARSRLWTPETFREVVAETAAYMDNQAGRRWRPLIDTARARQFTYDSPRAWRGLRRGSDYYYESALIWLEADVLIRQKSGGKFSLDDFCRRFFGGQNSAPMVKPYDYEEVLKTLGEIAPHDWRGFFDERVYAINERAPIGGIIGGGWRMVYTDTPNVQNQINEKFQSYVNLSYSIGAIVDEYGTISDITPDRAAGKAGLAPGMKITSIGGQEFSAEALREAVAATKNSSSPIKLTVENGGFKQTYTLNYQGGNRFPHLERDAAKSDILSEIIKPLSGINGFVPSSNSMSFAFSVRSGSNRRRKEVINMFADVMSVLLSQSEITAACPTNLNACSNKNRSIEISTEAIDPENDVLVYRYTVTGGKIIGQGSKVMWDLSGVPPGTYTITVGADDGCGVCGKTITKEIKVIECPDCK